MAGTYAAKGHVWLVRRLWRLGARRRGIPNVAFDLIAASDANADGAVTQEELAAVDITAEARYQVGSHDIKDLWSFIAYQATTVGHINGEGHCESLQ